MSKQTIEILDACSLFGAAPGSQSVKHSQSPDEFKIITYTRVFRLRNCFQHRSRMVRGQLLRLDDIVLIHEATQELSSRLVVFTVKRIEFVTSSVEAQKELAHCRPLKHLPSLAWYSLVVGLRKDVMLGRIVCARHPIVVGGDVR